jgi:hypothetical protein
MKDPELKLDKDKSSRGKKSTRRDWEGAIERQIREAMERGEFQNLPGRGKPLDLSSDPHVPPSWDLAFKLLKDAGFAPAWIERDKEIRVAKSQVFKPFQTYLSRTDEPRVHHASFEARLIADFRKQAAELNRLSDDFNLTAPNPRLHHSRIPIEAEVDKFREAIRKGRG